MEHKPILNQKNRKQACNLQRSFKSEATNTESFIVTLLCYLCTVYTLKSTVVSITVFVTLFFFKFLLFSLNSLFFLDTYPVGMTVDIRELHCQRSERSISVRSMSCLDVECP